MRLRPLAPAVVLLVAVTLYPPTARAEDPKDEVRAVVKSYVDAVNRNDASVLEALFAEDAVVMPPERRVRGRSEAVKFLNRNRPSLRFTRTINAVEISADLASVEGTIYLPPTRESGSFVTTLKRQADGSWRIVSDIWNAGFFPGAVLLR
jgi:uncharacterized protein (TIGR02246 family)